MKHIGELREQLAQVFEGLRDGSINPKDAIEMNNAAGKIIGTCKIELAYRLMQQDTKPIPFLETGNGSMIEKS